MSHHPNWRRAEADHDRYVVEGFLYLLTALIAAIIAWAVLIAGAIWFANRIRVIL